MQDDPDITPALAGYRRYFLQTQIIDEAQKDNFPGFFFL